MNFRPRSLWIATAVAPLAVLLSACEPVSLAMLSIGAGAGVAHQMGGLAYKTFTAPMPKVKTATLLALKRMGIRVESVMKTGNSETVYAWAADRRIEVEIEMLTSTTTRVRAVARKDTFLVDSATAVEILSQTEKALSA